LKSIVHASLVRRAAAAALLVACAARGSLAQSGDPGAPELLLPIGARTMGMGLAATAGAVGSDALWWNPALISRGPREVALQITQTLATQTGTDAGASVIYSVPRVGAIALSIRYLNQGSQPNTDTVGNQNGTFVPVSTVFAATFAAPFGDRLALGLTTKLLRISFPCTGVCDNIPGSPPQTGALDLGAQFLVRSDSIVSLGIAVRNIGFKLQINDTPQADALPGRAYFGISTAPKLAQLPTDVRIRAGADLVVPLTSDGQVGASLGGELSYRERYQLRAGYVSNGPTGSGVTFGLGVSTGKLQIDFARMLNDVSTQSGVTPTFVALRYLY
jgi:hypothetical protein